MSLISPLKYTSFYYITQRERLQMLPDLFTHQHYSWSSCLLSFKGMALYLRISKLWMIQYTWCHLMRHFPKQCSYRKSSFIPLFAHCNFSLLTPLINKHLIFLYFLGQPPALTLSILLRYGRLYHNRYLYLIH